MITDRHKAARDLRVAVVGCGHWGRNHVRNYAEIGALEAVVDHHAGRADELAASHGARRLSFEEALADPRVDALVLALPPSAHHPLGMRAVEAGKHVFVEKPMALRARDAEALCEAAERRGVRLMVGHILQYHPAFLRLKELVREGRLGRLQAITATRLNLGRMRPEEDAFWALAPHDVSMILSLVGAEPEQVEAVGGYHVRRSVADSATAHLRFPGNVQAQVFVSWLHAFKEQRLVVVGSEAMAVFDDAVPWERKLVLYPHRVAWEDGAPVTVAAEGEPVPLVEQEPLREECLHFLECIRTGARPRTDGREGLRVLRVLERGSEALSASREPGRTRLQGIA